MSKKTFVMPNDLSELCRVCLQLPEESQYLDLTTIYDEEDNLSYGECFTICTQIDLSAGEGVPHHLCKSCGLELQMSYDFHKKIEESKRVIEQYQLQNEEQKANAIKILKSSGHSNKSTLEQLEEVQIICDKFEESYQEEELPVTPQEPEEDCEMKQDNDPGFISNIEIDDEVNDEMDIINKMCHDEVIKQQETPPYEENVSAKEINENINQDHLEMEDYQNLEALEEEDLPPSVLLKEASPKTNFKSEQDTITSTTITPCIPTGIRLPLPPGPPFKCEFCGHSSNTKNLLASHRHRKHRYKESFYQCYKCEKQFNSKDSFDKHTKRLSCQHYPQFTCEYCYKIIKGSANYKIHLRFHQKIYPYECDKCGKGFMMAIHLKTHVQTKHENKRYICEEPQCGKFFQSHQSLKSHMYVHLGSMPYCCYYCEKMFPNRGRLRWHIKTSHDFETCPEDMDCMLVSEEISIKAKVKTVDFSN